MPLRIDKPVSSVVIAGAGGFGLEVFDYLDREARQGGPRVAGFIDDAAAIPELRGVEAPFLGPIAGFQAQPLQVVVVAIGSVAGRAGVLSRLWATGVQTPAFAATSAIVSPSVSLGAGVVICPFAIVNHNARLGDGVVVNVHCSIGHGASAGAFAVLSPYAALNGDASVGARCFLGTRATIYPRVSIGEECVVDSHAAVRACAGERKMISARGVYRVNDVRTMG